MANRPSDADVGANTAAPAPKPQARGALGLPGKILGPLSRGWTIAILAVVAWGVLILAVLAIVGLFTG